MAYTPFFIEAVIWFFPIIFMFHVLEEIITLDSFMAKFKNNVPRSFLAKFAFKVKKMLGTKSTQFSISVAWILLIITFITFKTAFHLPMGGNFLLFIAVLNIFFLQAFSHIGQTFILRVYTPGVITAFIIVIPYSLLTYSCLFELGLIDGHLLFKSIPFSMVMVPIFLIGNLLGQRFNR
ncbi:HXXEE domain-containing protein [Bacillus salipaludis]|uniref:HXXEE domain-containing protein n=1 Tax=Bacillus salipaludis TaxID=2547811 RepID=A0A4V3AU39_9BACI|nr:HXXEE domain-containing protein [Bacillus salipaludis]MDQ6597604.1 HXXEE domain-containing protein [Bacillus salipaludis]TDK62983.1 HXXEE domain-containing protein [Bacillus salipaludis]